MNRVANIVYPLGFFAAGLMVGLIISSWTGSSIDAHLFEANEDLALKSKEGEFVIKIPSGYPIYTVETPESEVDIGFLFYIPVYAGSGGMASELVVASNRPSAWAWMTVASDRPSLFAIEDISDDTSSDQP